MWHVALLVTLVHKIFKSAAAGSPQDGNMRGDDEASKREVKQPMSQ